MKKLMIADLMVIGLVFAFATPLWSQENNSSTSLDKRVKAFLSSHANEWHSWNVPEADGKLLHDIIIKNGYTRALEIGTSTGRSTIWIAWALSKTGGKVTTIEIDESRYKTALKNFKKAGLSQYIDARLADAHELVLILKGPFDFVFSDADKGWYKNYFDALAPKLVVGGCYTSHNVSNRGGGGFGLSGYVKYLKGLRNFETTFDNSGAGIAISYKKSEK